MKDRKIIYNNLQSLNDIERKAIDIYENGTRKEFRDFFEENFEIKYISSFGYTQFLQIEDMLPYKSLLAKSLLAELPQ